MLQSDSNTLEENVASNNGGEGGFHIADSSNNTFTRNVANNNATVGFGAFFDSEFNVFSENTGRKNGLVDARDAGIANVWTNNNFGTTQGI